ncbi:hypothetical protein BO78DRAFT_415709 [Aspergillus sclerotiicarbonarius CBS 121057]|uniref:F-box domain-containing protein n=1 Tax=Aspergillus sclerotiicarbonarius (strain CBS 121057 / IBT 28362) TaxID=1448318 RepID=A0A319EXH3_ASPSB|nr:hypothetical protein BO78DRAFT_415709 [Aspergillus sclerotiicarbonarius CBS 121057]
MSVSQVPPPELLELILLQLEYNEVFQMQRVCCHWREVIRHSTAIRWTLFLERPRWKGKVKFNPFLYHLGFIPPSSSVKSMQQFLSMRISQPHNFTLSPLLPGCWRLREPNWFTDPRHRDIIFDPEGSWRQTWPVNIPCVIEQIIINFPGKRVVWNGYRGGLWVLGSEDVGNGLTMGRLFDILMAFFCHFQRETALFFWRVRGHESDGECTAGTKWLKAELDMSCMVGGEPTELQKDSWSVGRGRLNLADIIDIRDLEEFDEWV